MQAETKLKEFMAWAKDDGPTRARQVAAFSPSEAATEWADVEDHKNDSLRVYDRKGLGLAVCVLERGAPDNQKPAVFQVYGHWEISYFAIKKEEQDGHSLEQSKQLGQS
jgi:hypothetical protein